MPALHPQTRVMYHGQEISVDSGMVELLAALWGAGIETYGSCESLQYGGDARIWFRDEDSFKRFQGVVGGRLPSGQGWPVDFPSDDIPRLTELFRSTPLT